MLSWAKIILKKEVLKVSVNLFKIQCTRLSLMDKKPAGSKRKNRGNYDNRLQST